MPDPSWKSIRRGAPLIIGHRGHAEKYPENTLLSFKQAVLAGADMVECDYRPTADGVLVCAHDDAPGHGNDTPPEARAPASHNRKISTSPASEVTRWNTGTRKHASSGNTRIPTLEDAVKQILGDGAVPTLERKKGSPEQTLETLDRADARERVCVMSFDLDFLRALRAIAPELTLAAIGRGAFPRNSTGTLKNCGADIVNWDYYGLTEGDVAFLHQAGFPVWTWTVNRNLEFGYAASMGIDALTTDAPDRLAAFLKRGT